MIRLTDVSRKLENLHLIYCKPGYLALFKILNHIQVEYAVLDRLMCKQPFSHIAWTLVTMVTCVSYETLWEFPVTLFFLFTRFHAYHHTVYCLIQFILIYYLIFLIVPRLQMGNQVLGVVYGECNSKSVPCLGSDGLAHRFCWLQLW